MFKPWPLRRFRVRSTQRSLADAAARQSEVKQALLRQADAAKFELEGLKRRMDEELAIATAALENAPEYEIRSASEERLIAYPEAAALEAGKQIRRLEHELAMYQSLLARLEDGSVEDSDRSTAL